MTSCARCGHELGVGRFCLNCGHPVGEPVPGPEPSATVADRPTVSERPAVSEQPTVSEQPMASEQPPVVERHDAAVERSDAAVEQSDGARPAWVPWVIGVGLVLVLLGVLALAATWLAGDDDPAESAVTETDPTSEDGPAPAPPIEDLTPTLRVSAPPAAPASTDLDGQPVRYGARLMLDGVPDTAWRTPGDATGQTVTFSLPGDSSVRQVGLVNGNAATVPDGDTLVDWYPLNRRIIRVEWVFDDGTSVRQDLRERSTLQRLTIDPVTTRQVQLRLLTVTAPGPGALGRDFTAISEVLVAGTPAA